MKKTLIIRNKEWKQRDRRGVSLKQSEKHTYKTKEERIEHNRTGRHRKTKKSEALNIKYSSIFNDKQKKKERKNY